MSCCGQKRAAVRRENRTAPGARGAAAPVHSRPRAAGATRVVYSGSATVRVFGERTGRSYVFSHTAREHAMDGGDAAGVIRSSPLFRTAA